MEEAIKKGIAEGIEKSFGEKYSIYTDAVKQGIEKPCFFILNKKCTFDRLLGKRARAKYFYEIEYYEEDRQKKENDFMKLFSVLNIIDTAEGKMLGRNLSFSIEREKGIFSVEYWADIIFKEEESEYMEKLERKDV